MRLYITINGNMHSWRVMVSIQEKNTGQSPSGKVSRFERVMRGFESLLPRLQLLTVINFATFSIRVYRLTRVNRGTYSQ